METVDSTRSSASGDTSDGASASKGRGAGGRRKLNDTQEREVARLYGETARPVSEISKQFGIGESSVYRLAERHGVPLRGRTAKVNGGTSKASASGSGAAATQARPGRGRRRAASSTGAAATRATAAPSTPRRGRRAGSASTSGSGAGARSTAAPATGSTATRGPGRGRRAGALATRGQRGSATRSRAAATPARATSAAAAAVVRFRVSFVAEAVVVANDLRAAILAAEKLGATEITAITRAD